jgi:tellurite methyltransferase
MDLAGWNERFRLQKEVAPAPTPLLVQTAEHLQHGRALDLACGAGGNALWLAEHGWAVTAVDGSTAAIDVLRRHAAERVLSVDTRVADLEKGEYYIEPSSWDLIVISYYLQRDLFERALKGLIPGGVLMAIVLMGEHGEEHRLKPGELITYFDGCEILHSHEGSPTGQGHHRSVAEIVVRRVEVE